jgi:YfiH family protein
MTMIEYIVPDWQVPAHVKAISTLRSGGASKGNWQGLNLAQHVADNPEHVMHNRQLLQQNLAINEDIYWLQQIHGTRVVAAGDADNTADAVYSSQPGEVCAVLTADCLPVLFSNSQGTQVAAAHAGWRGLVAGVLEATVHTFDPSDQVHAWLGPAIGPQAFEVGAEVRQAFVQHSAQAEQAFTPSRPGHWMADIYQLARQRLNAAGVQQVSGGGLCTYSDAKRFYSYRRDQCTGRMASLVWLLE